MSPPSGGGKPRHETPGRDPVALLERATTGDRVSLARLLSIVERGGPASRRVAALAYRRPPPYTLGLTGAPGAGKSTLTDRLISAARAGWPGGDDRPGEPLDQVAVLAVDPTSPYSGGAILGDRVRMQRHATDEQVFIRSMATRGHLGGLALAVPDAVRVLGAVGMPVVETVATTGEGVDELWSTVAEHRAHLQASGQLERRRAERLGQELRRVLTARVLEQVQQVSGGSAFADAARALVGGETDPYTAADGLLG